MNKDFSKTAFLLFPDEKVIVKINPHWLLLVFPLTGIFIAWFLCLFFLCPINALFNLEWFCFLFSFISFPFAILVFYLDWRFNRIYLTNFRLVKERGIIGQRFMSVFYEQIEDVVIWYGFWGRVFGFGDLEIESAGTYGKMIFKGAPNPQVKKWLILNEMQKIKRKR